MAGGASGSVDVDGQRVRVTNLNKILYPDAGTTKGEVIAYYQAVAPWMLTHVVGRPATRKRWPNGVGTDAESKDAFFQKGLDAQSTPSWVATAALQHDDGETRYPLVNDAATLVWLAQLAALEIHVPQWQVDEEGRATNPDRLVLDLDPGPGATMGQCVELAHLVREVLEGAGMQCAPVTSGSKGIHLYAPLDGSLTSADASDFAHQLARSLEGLRPDLVVSDMRKTLREGKVLLDWSQNNGSKTTIAPYSLRGRVRPTVAAPRRWEELTPDLTQLEFTEVVQRLTHDGDPLTELFPGVDRLSVYRSLRDASITPEPVPAGRPAGGMGNTFVIQRHQARRLHHDFRLEHDGVLVSWALPKGPPTDPGKNHLAVQTEDHPLGYATFEGDIPKGQYGGGHVEIWDAGTFALEKWRDGKEVIATLTGSPDGGLGGEPRRFALIHTGMGGDTKNWLIHLMEPESGAATQDDADADADEMGTGTQTLRVNRVGPAPLAPMLATAGELGDVSAGEWTHEIKWDGYRALASVHGGQWRLTSRSGRDMTSAYPELEELVAALAGHDAVLDGEIVMLDDAGVSRFGLLQNHGRGGDAHYMAFDLLHRDGESLMQQSHAERRSALEKLVVAGLHRVHVPPVLGGDAGEALATSRDLGLEGIVSKSVGSRYEPGHRSAEWVKIKNIRTQDVVVIGWSPGRGSRALTLGSVLLAVPEEGVLRYVGKAGSGFSDLGLTQAREVLESMETSEPPVADIPRNEAQGARWVEPLLVGEVRFAEWTTGGRLRQPVWRCWRPEASAGEVQREA